MDKNETKTVVDRVDFASKGDWINTIFYDHATIVAEDVAPVAAVAEVKDEDGKVITEAVPAIRARKGKTTISVDSVLALAAANNLRLKEGGYPNDGMTRMNVGNMLRAAARKRHGLMLPVSPGLASPDSEYEFTSAPSNFMVNSVKTHDPYGAKIAKVETAEAAG